MPSIRRQKAKARKLKEMDLLSDFENMDVILGDENSNPIEKKLANTIIGYTSKNDTNISTINKIHHKKMRSGIIRLRV